MRANSMKMVLQVMGLAVLIPGVLVADEVRHSLDGRSVVIKFDEPVVPLSVVEKSRDGKLSTQDRGLDLFSLTGCEAEYLPEVYWLDQDRLQLIYREGFDAETEFRVSFHAGTAHYLSGRQMPEASFNFHCRAQSLARMDIKNGLIHDAVCLYVDKPLTKGQQNFSSATPFRYEFREVVKEHLPRHDDKRYGRRVRGVAEPLQVRHLPPQLVLPKVFGAKRKPSDISREELLALSEDTIVPRHVLVRPEAELPGANKWELLADPDMMRDFAEDMYPAQQAVPLRIKASTDIVHEKAKEVLRLSVSFNAPVRRSELEGIFRALELKVGERAAVLNEDGRSKTLTLSDGRKLTFTLREPGRLLPAGEHFSYSGEREHKLSYTPPCTNTIDMDVSGSEALPQVLDICLPAGTKAMLGASNSVAERVRLSLAPLLPQLQEMSTLRVPALVPLNGAHKLHLSAGNLQTLRVSVARLTPTQFLMYAGVLSKYDFGSVDELAEARYDLARLATCLKLGLPEGNKDKVKNASNWVKQLQRRTVTFDALRAQLHDVSFTEAREVKVSVPEGADIATGEALIDMDAMMGGKAQPGFYIVSVRRCATPEVQEQLRRVGAETDNYDTERWYPVLLTDLNLITAADAVMVNHLSSGAPVEQGQLIELMQEPCELQNGAVLVPPTGKKRSRSDYGRWLVVQSGEDYVPLNWDEQSVRLSDDCRMELVRDRGTYRPGEEVHLRGMLRSVSPKGLAVIPNVRTVNISVNRPNGTRLLEKNVRVNEYGAFDMDFTLPKGDEDVTGDYRVLARSDDYRAYSYVSCEVFRRDSFTVESELVLEPVGARECTVQVKAVDLNGTPLSGAVATLKTDVEMAQSNAEGKNTSASHQLTLGKDGSATLTLPLPEMSPGASIWVTVRGEVRNDREEVMRLPSRSAGTYPADFSPRFRDSDLLLLDKIMPRGEKAVPLDREQKIHLRLKSRLPRREVLPNGVLIESTIPLTLWEGDVMVPAHAVNGVPTGMLAHWRSFADSLAAGDERFATPPMLVELTATDAAGRRLERFFRLYGNRPVSVWNGGMKYGSMSATPSENGLKIKAVSEREGKAMVLLRSVQGTRVLPPVSVKAGENELTLTLLAEEVGTVHVCMLMPMEAEGLFTQAQVCRTEVQVPNRAAELKVELQLPQEAVRPGERVTLAGKVQGASLPAQVTLLAVDEGMLSVDSYRMPNLLGAFTYVWVENFYPRLSSRQRLDRSGAGVELQLMNGIWKSQWLDADGKIIKHTSSFTPCCGAGSPRTMGIASYSRKLAKKSKGAVNRAYAMPDEDGGLGVTEECAEPMSMDSANAQMAAPEPVAGATETGAGGPAAPRLRDNFIPVALWAPALKTDEQGNFRTEVTLPDTFTTYKVFALALGRDGKTFGNGEGSFVVNQPIMLTPGTPLFMSMGDCLRLPLTITNATSSSGTWVVMLEGTNSLQRVTLAPKASATLYFDYTATEEGLRRLHWKAVSPKGGDAVEGSFEVRFPAPLLKEAHHLVLQEGGEALKVAGLLAPELAGSSRGELKVLLSANPLLHLYGCMELVHGGDYPCTQYRATSMLAWMLYDRLAPFSPIMAQTEPGVARSYVTKGISELLKCQQEDGGISFWCGARRSSPWTSAYVGLLLSLAREQGFDVPQDAMSRLGEYLKKQLELSRKEVPEVTFSSFDLYAIGRTIGDRSTLSAALNEALAGAESRSDEAAIFAPVQTCCWWRTSQAVASLRFLAEMDRDKGDIHSDFLRWMRAVGHDYRHSTHWDGGWMLIALHEYLRRSPGSNAQSTLALQDGTQLTLGQGMTTLSPSGASTLGELPLVLSPTGGTSYITVQAKALPDRTDYPGVTEKGLQITRIYEKRGADGVWREAREFNVGDVVRVTLTCAKSDRELEYFVLEDYLPACMEAINPNIPSQAAGLEWSPWSHWFDHKEYLASRVRGFCTRWGSRDLLNMSYYARVKRAGTSTAPPAQGQLMYEPQIYGLSPNALIISK